MSIESYAGTARSLLELKNIVNMYKYGLVYVEGCTCSGKSTLAQSLALSLGRQWQYYKAWKNIREDADALAGLEIEVGQTVLAAADLCSRTRINLVCDRSPISTYVFRVLANKHRFDVIIPSYKAVERRMFMFYQYLEMVPGIVVWLDPNLNTIEKRLKARGSDKSDESLEIVRHEYSAMHEVFKKVPKRHIIHVPKPLFDNVAESIV